MTQSEFTNALRIMLSIDRPEFDQTVSDGDWDGTKSGYPDWADRQWDAFRTDPFRFFARCSDWQADALWRIVEARQPKDSA